MSNGRRRRKKTKYVLDIEYFHYRTTGSIPVAVFSINGGFMTYVPVLYVELMTNSDYNGKLACDEDFNALVDDDPHWNSNYKYIDGKTAVTLLNDLGFNDLADNFNVFIESITIDYWESISEAAAATAAAPASLKITLKVPSANNNDKKKVSSPLSIEKDRYYSTTASSSSGDSPPKMKTLFIDLVTPNNSSNDDDDRTESSESTPAPPPRQIDEGIGNESTPAPPPPRQFDEEGSEHPPSISLSNNDVRQGENEQSQFPTPKGVGNESTPPPPPRQFNEEGSEHPPSTPLPSRQTQFNKRSPPPPPQKKRMSKKRKTNRGEKGIRNEVGMVAKQPPSLSNGEQEKPPQKKKWKRGTILEVFCTERNSFQEACFESYIGDDGSKAKVFYPGKARPTIVLTCLLFPQRFRLWSDFVVGQRVEILSLVTGGYSAATIIGHNEDDDTFRVVYTTLNASNGLALMDDCVSRSIMRTAVAQKKNE